jgi:hypothetical protein
VLLGYVLPERLGVRERSQVRQTDRRRTPGGSSCTWETTNSCTDESTERIITETAPVLKGNVNKGVTVQANFTEANMCSYDPVRQDFVCGRIDVVGTVFASFTLRREGLHGPVPPPGVDAGPSGSGVDWSTGTPVDAAVSFVGTIVDGVPVVPRDGHLLLALPGTSSRPPPGRWK